MLGYVILLNMLIAYVLRRYEKLPGLVKSLKLTNLLLCMVLLVLNPWMIPVTIAILVVALLYIKYRGLPKSVGLWE